MKILNSYEKFLKGMIINMVKVVLFDLDGTLLPMNQDKFIEAYMGSMAKKLSNYGYEPKKLAGGVWAGIEAMMKNDGSMNNEEAFWQNFCKVLGEKAREDAPIFEEFYKNEFQDVKHSCGYHEKAKEVVTFIKECGGRVVLATNPLFPAIATESRIRWAGLLPEDFEWYTTYENSSFCKPNPKYYLEILEKIGVTPEDCLMVGNDVGDDMPAETIGMKVFLLTDCLINKEEKDISVYPHGGFEELFVYLKEVLG